MTVAGVASGLGRRSGQCLCGTGAARVTTVG